MRSKGASFFPRDYIISGMLRDVTDGALRQLWRDTRGDLTLDGIMDGYPASASHVFQSFIGSRLLIFSLYK